MPIEIPYTFVAGTKAKASEVNADFNAVANFVDQLELDSAEMETLVTTLNESKANLNGLTNEIFRMADAVSDYDGVNLRTLRRLTANCKGTIFGFKVSKQSNTAVNATSGACWDSTYTDMITSSTNLIKDQSGLSANATYYVYVTSDKETGECELVISLSNATPELPTGYEYYRRLATVTTDGSGYIDSVTNDGDVEITGKVGFIGTRLATQTSPAQQNMWIKATHDGQDYSNCWVTIGDMNVSVTGGGKWSGSDALVLPIKKGQTFSYGGAVGWSVQFYSMS